MLKEQMDWLIPMYLICVQKRATKKEETKLSFLDAASDFFHPGIPKSHPSLFKKSRY